jgi:hypothetical protein
MRVLAAHLLDEVSITLAEDDDGWRFESWARSGMLEDKLLPPPPADALARRFAGAEEAKAFFRTICPKGR